MKEQAVVPKQALSLLSVVSLNADFNAIPSEIMQDLIDNPQQTGMQFTAWLKNRGRLILPGPRILQIDRARTFNPTEFIGANWSIWRGPVDGDGLEGDEDQDLNALALSEIDLNNITFDCLEKDERVVKGEEKLLRLKAKPSIRCDGTIFQAIWENKELIPESWKEKVNGKTRFIYFDGTILRDPDGFRCVLYLYFRDGAWDWYYLWLDDEWDSGNPSAVLASN